MDVRWDFQLRQSGEVSSPVLWGWRRPWIIIPIPVASWTDEQVGFMLRHELAHLARCDNLYRQLAFAACAAFWFNPLVWLAERFLRIEQERACDNLVLQSGGRPSGYARVLLALADHLLWPKHWSPAQFLSRFTLKDRLAWILADAVDRSRPTRLSVGSRVAVILLVAVSAVVLRPGNRVVLGADEPQPTGWIAQWRQGRRTFPPGILQPMVEDRDTSIRQTPSGGALSESAALTSNSSLGQRIPLLPPGVEVRSSRTLMPRVAADIQPPGGLRSATYRYGLPVQRSLALAQRVFRLGAPLPADPRVVTDEEGGSVPSSEDGESKPAVPAPDRPEPQRRLVGFKAERTEIYDPYLLSVEPVEINDQGVVALNLWGGSAPQRPALWSEATGTVELGAPRDWLITHASRINRENQVLATSFGPLAGQKMGTALWLLSSDGSYQAIDVPQGCTTPAAFDLNDRGEVLAECGVPFFWSGATGAVQLGFLPEEGETSQGWTRATALNNAGQIVGTSNLRAFVWSLDSGIRELPGLVDRLESDPSVPGPPTSTWGFDINDAGQVVGRANFQSGSQGESTAAFVWTPEAGARIMWPRADESGFWPDSIHSQAQAISPSGYILAVSYRGTADESGFSTPIIGAISGSPHVIEDISLSLVEATSHHRLINSSGWFVGNNHTRSPEGDLGERHPFVWIPDVGMVDLSVEGESLSSVALAITESGLVLGGGAPSDASEPGGGRALIWKLVPVYEDQEESPSEEGRASEAR